MEKIMRFTRNLEASSLLWPGEVKLVAERARVSEGVRS